MPQKIRSLPTERIVVYPSSDGKPMAETDIHRKLITNTIEILDNHFKERDDVYVSGNLLLYYEKGNPKKSVAPDVFVVLGIEKKRRRTYLLWEEEKGPDFVLELVSRNTYQKDLGEKKDLYASVFKVKEYYLYDPDGQYLQPSLHGYRLTNGVYLPIQSVGAPCHRRARIRSTDDSAWPFPGPRVRPPSLLGSDNRRHRRAIGPVLMRTGWIYHCHWHR